MALRLLVVALAATGCAHSMATKPYCDRVYEDTAVKCGDQRADGTGPPAGVGPHRAILSSKTLPISFARLQKENGKYQLGTTMDLGVGYTFMLGTATYNDTDKSLTFDPAVVIGAAISGGVRQSTMEGAQGEYGGYAFLGLGPIAGTIGHDFNSSSWYFGLNLKVDAFVFKKDEYTAWKVW